jgi:hypothetical protein
VSEQIADLRDRVDRIEMMIMSQIDLELSRLCDTCDRRVPCSENREPMGDCGTQEKNVKLGKGLRHERETRP